MSRSFRFNNKQAASELADLLLNGYRVVSASQLPQVDYIVLQHTRSGQRLTLSVGQATACLFRKGRLIKQF